MTRLWICCTDTQKGNADKIRTWNADGVDFRSRNFSRRNVEGWTFVLLYVVSYSYTIFSRTGVRVGIFMYPFRYYSKDVLLVNFCNFCILLRNCVCTELIYVLPNQDPGICLCSITLKEMFTTVPLFLDNVILRSSTLSTFKGRTLHSLLPHTEGIITFSLRWNTGL